MHFTNNCVEGINHVLNGLLNLGKSVQIEKFNEIINIVIKMYHSKLL